MNTCNLYLLNYIQLGFNHKDTRSEKSGASNNQSKSPHLSFPVFLSERLPVA